MPEMPEVETIRRTLAPFILKNKISNVEVLLDRLIKFPKADKFVRAIKGTTIIELNRTGKYLRFLLSNEMELIVHLRMTGQLIYVPDKKIDIKYTRLRFEFADGTSLIYADLRTLGAIYLVSTAELGIIKGLASMGAEPLTKEFTFEYLTETVKGRRIKIKSFLLNQSYIGGLGNIYADEALFLAGINPERLVNSLDKTELKRIYKAVNKVISDGIADGGTTFSDYRDGTGKKGTHQDKLNVYQRTNKPCKKCGTVIERLIIGGRSSHFCPKCQTVGKEKKKC